MTTTFSTNPVTPTGSSTLTVSNTAAGPAGTYNVDVTGTSGTKSRAAQLVLTVATQAPDSVATISPADGAQNVQTSPTFTWAASNQAALYTIEIATDSDFNNMIAVDQVTGTSYTLPASLAPLTTYYWRVSANNACGTNTVSTGSSFTTQNIVCIVSGQAIPENNAAGFDSSTAIGLGGEITDLNVSLSAVHTYVGDLIFTLTHEDTGTSAVIIDRPGFPASAFGCSNNDVEATMDDEGDFAVETQCAPGPALEGSLIPENPLSAFDGEDLAGTWTLNVSDNAGGDTGTLNEWCLIPAIADTVVDTDGDGVGDDVDNCTDVANADQRDTNGDGFGNICDPDIDNNGVVNFLDVNAWVPNFNTACGDVDEDFNGDGVCNFSDYALFAEYFLLPPGPGAGATSN